MFATQSKDTDHSSNTYIQPQLEVGSPDDEYEKEANDVADKVMRMPEGEQMPKMNTGNESIQMMKMDEEPIKMANHNEGKIQMMMDYPKIQMKCDECEEEDKKELRSGTPDIQMKCEKCDEEKEEKIQKKSDTTDPQRNFASQEVTSQIHNSKGNGQALPKSVQTDLGNKMNANLDNVKVHTDDHAAQLNKSLGAKAFTYGDDIYFNSGQYNPHSNEGKHLLTHELTHTIQQNSSPVLVRRQVNDSGGIHSTSFTNLEEMSSAGTRGGTEFEVAMQLICQDTGSPVDMNLLYRFLSNNDWEIYKQVMQCSSCAAFSSGFGVENTDWSEASHSIRELSPYVWTSVEEANFNPDNDLTEQVQFNVDLYDDYYLDTPELTLLNNDWVLRTRTRFMGFEEGDDVEIRRILIQVKNFTEGVTEGGLKSVYKDDVRRDSPSDTMVEGLLENAASGTTTWEEGKVKAIPFIKEMYNDLASKEVLPDVGEKKDVLDLKPQSFVRSVRGRYHHTETETARISEFKLRGEEILNQIKTLVNEKLNLRKTRKNKPLNDSLIELLGMVNGYLDFSAILELAKGDISALDPNSEINVDLIKRLVPTESSTYLPDSSLEVEEMHIVAQALSTQMHKISSLLKANDAYLAGEIWGQPLTEQSWEAIRQIESAGSASLGLWFDISRRFYVNEMPRFGNDFYIDTFDLSGMYTPDAWGDTPMSDRTNQEQPDIEKLYYMSLVNETQIELRQERPYLEKIAEYEKGLNEAMANSQDDLAADMQRRLDGVKFLLQEYQNTAKIIGEQKGNYIIETLKTAINDARNRGEEVPECENWAWVPITRGKGEAALENLPK